MTQIIGVVTRDAVFVVSDRRLTHGIGPRIGQVFDDDTCKLVSICSTCAVAYTGFGHLGIPPQPTHEWIASVVAANDCNRGSVAARILIAEANTAFANLPFALTHSFVMGGFGRFFGTLRPYLCTVTNSMSADGVPLTSPGRTFIGAVTPLPDEAAFGMIVVGRPLRSPVREKVLGRMLRRLVERGISPKTILKLLVDEVIYTSKSDGTVGSKVLATVIPRAAAEQDQGMILEGDPNDHTASFGYFEPGYEGIVQFGPTFTCNGWAVTNVRTETDGDKQSTEVRILRKPSSPDPSRGIAIGVRAGQGQGYFWDLAKNRLMKMVNGERVELGDSERDADSRHAANVSQPAAGGLAPATVNPADEQPTSSDRDKPDDVSSDE